MYAFTVFSLWPLPIHQLRYLSIDSTVRVVVFVDECIVSLFVSLSGDGKCELERCIEQVLHRNKFFFGAGGEVPRHRHLAPLDRVEELDVSNLIGLDTVYFEVVSPDYKLSYHGLDPSPALIAMLAVELLVSESRLV